MPIYYAVSKKCLTLWEDTIEPVEAYRLSLGSPCDDIRVYPITKERMLKAYRESTDLILFKDEKYAIAYVDRKTSKNRDYFFSAESPPMFKVEYQGSINSTAFGIQIPQQQTKLLEGKMRYSHWKQCNSLPYIRFNDSDNNINEHDLRYIDYEYKKILVREATHCNLISTILMVALGLIIHEFNKRYLSNDSAVSIGLYTLPFLIADQYLEHLQSRWNIKLEQEAIKIIRRQISEQQEETAILETHVTSKPKVPSLHLSSVTLFETIPKSRCYAVTEELMPLVRDIKHYHFLWAGQPSIVYSMTKSRIFDLYKQSKNIFLFQHEHAAIAFAKNQSKVTALGPENDITITTDLMSPAVLIVEYNELINFTHNPLKVARQQTKLLEGKMIYKGRNFCDSLPYVNFQNNTLIDKYGERNVTITKRPDHFIRMAMGVISCAALPTDVNIGVALVLTVGMIGAHIKYCNHRKDEKIAKASVEIIEHEAREDIFLQRNNGK